MTPSVIRGPAPGPGCSTQTIAPLVAAGVAAHGAVVGLTALSVRSQLVTAAVATVVFAGITLACGRRLGAMMGPSRARARRVVVDYVLVFATVGLIGWLVGRLLGTGAAFYCEPLVPWRVEIAIFGSFGLAYLTSMAHRRHRAWAVYPLVVLALVAIAPFYGFFSAPLFLALSLNTMCPGRPIVVAVLIAIGMGVGERLGIATAAWLSEGTSATKERR